MSSLNWQPKFNLNAEQLNKEKSQKMQRGEILTVYFLIEPRLYINTLSKPINVICIRVYEKVMEVHLVTQTPLNAPCW